MPSLNPATLSHISDAIRLPGIGISCLRPWRIKASLLILLSLFVMLPPSLVRGDDLTGLSQDDPKDLLPAPQVSASQPTGPIGAGMFAPMPGWSRLGAMPPLPDQLKPMGKKTVVATNTPPTVIAPLAPPKDTTPVVSTQDTTAKPKTPAVATESTPALIAVSPFLQWVKTNPQAAAAQAREQANSYHVPPTPDANGGTGNGPAGVTGDPYWLPPLIDSPDIIPGATGGSAAIYSTPQR
jgi:hypothetical protein